VKERFGIHVVIEAMPQVRQALPEATLTIIHGAFDPAYRVELEEKIASLGLQECVQLEKFRPLEEIVKFIHESDIGIVPYMSDIFMDIALSTKSFEYVAMGLPVVASRLPSITSLFDEECVAYFEAGNAEDCAQPVSSTASGYRKKKASCEKCPPSLSGNSLADYGKAVCGSHQQGDAKIGIWREIISGCSFIPNHTKRERRYVRHRGYLQFQRR
jgi:glycosyltransferase involved in cell wall biosynthesis